MSDRLPLELWDSFRNMYASLAKQDIQKMLRLGRAELKARHETLRLENQRAAEGYRGLANFMAGVTWALACRQALRESKDHPGFGKRPAAGDMWLPRELLLAVRAQVKERGWHPITAASWGTVRERLLAEPRYRAGLQREREVQEGVFHQQQFAVRMASHTASRFVDDRFDQFYLGGRT